MVRVSSNKRLRARSQRSCPMSADQARRVTPRLDSGLARMVSKSANGCLLTVLRGQDGVEIEWKRQGLS